MPAINMATDMTREEDVSSCSPFIAAGGFDALKRACTEIVVGPRQSGDPAEDVYVDLHFTYADGYDGPCFGETEVTLSPGVKNQAVVNGEGGLSSLSNQDTGCNGSESVQLASGDHQESGVTASDDGSLEAISIFRQESALSTSDQVSNFGEEMLGFLSQGNAKAIPQKDEPSDLVAAAGISHISPAPDNSHNDGPVCELRSNDVAAGHNPDETKVTTASSPEIPVTVVHSVGTPSTNSKLADSAEVKQRETTIEDLGKETRGKQHLEAGQVQLNEDNRQSGCGLLRKTSITGVFKTLHRSFSRDRTGSGGKDHVKETKDHTNQDRDTVAHLGSDEPTTAASTEEPVGIEVNISKTTSHIASEQELVVVADSAEQSGTVDTGAGNVSRNIRSAEERHLPTENETISPDSEQMNADDEPTVDNELLKALQGAVKLHRMLSIKQAIDAVRRIGSGGQRSKKNAEGQASVVQGSRNGIEESADAPKQTAAKPMHDTEQFRTTEDKKAAVHAKSLHRKLSTKKAVEVVRRIGSAGGQLSKTAGDQLPQESNDLDHGVADENAVSPAAPEEISDQSMLESEDVLRVPENATKLHRKFSMQKVADAIRRIGSAGRQSPRTTDEHNGNHHAGLGQGDMAAKEEIQSEPAMAREQPIEVSVPNEILPAEPEMDSEQPVEDRGVFKSVQNGTLQRKFSIRKAVEAVKRVGSGSVGSGPPERKTGETGNRNEQRAPDGGSRNDSIRPARLQRMFSNASTQSRYIPN